MNRSLQFSKTSVQSLNSSIFSMWQLALLANLKACISCQLHVLQHLTHLMPRTEIQENANLDLLYCQLIKFAKIFNKVFSFVLSECRQPGDPKGVQEAGSEAAPGQKRRRG